MQQVGKDGKTQTVKTLAGRNKAPDLSLARMAPPDSTQDKMWGWFNDIHDKGILLSRPHEQPQERLDRHVRLDPRRGRPVQLHQRLAEQDLHRPAVSVDSNDPVKETITLTIERLARVK